MKWRHKAACSDAKARIIYHSNKNEKKWHILPSPSKLWKFQNLDMLILVEFTEHHSDSRAYRSTTTWRTSSFSPAQVFTRNTSRTAWGPTSMSALKPTSKNCSQGLTQVATLRERVMHCPLNVKLPMGESGSSFIKWEYNCPATTSLIALLFTFLISGLSLVE